MRKFCGGCQAWKVKSDFDKNRAKKDGLQTQCRTCLKSKNQKWYKNNRGKANEKSREQRLRLKETVDSIKRANKCCNCGENDACCLDFHHRGEKLNEVANMVRQLRGISSILSEINKCVVLCANCHRKLHAGKLRMPKKVKINLP